MLMRFFLGLLVGLCTLGFLEAADPLPLAGAVIVVDPGHGGQSYSRSYTGGTRGIQSKLTESELNLRVGLVLARKLREQGATVYLTREADHRLSAEGSTNKDELHARIDFFEHHNCHFFLSIHHNAGGRNSTGHTTLYKHNASDDTLYESLAQIMNDSLEGAMPGPKLKLIKGSYHILRETPIPGTILESGFQTSPEFDVLSNKPEFPEIEAKAALKGAIQYWAAYRTQLIAFREKLTKERAAAPRDPNKYTAIALNPAHQARMNDLLQKVAPDGKATLASAAEAVTRLTKKLEMETGRPVGIKAEVAGEQVRLTGSVSNRADHDQVINLLVAMKVYRIKNEIELPKAK